MNSERLRDDVLNLIDAHSDTLSKQQYYDFLGELISDLESREEAVRDELESEDN